MQITLNLDKKARRPVVSLNWFSGCRALIDTGAVFPVWVASEDVLSDKLGARLIRRGVHFGGFGGETEGSVYRVNFELGPIHFLDMPIVAKRMKELNCHLILPATMFDSMIYEIDTVNHKLNINTVDNQIVKVLRVSNDNWGLSVYTTDTFGESKYFTEEIKKF